MLQSLLARVLFLIYLPALVLQLRFFIYKRSDKGGPASRADLIEAMPHDLAIMGLTLAFAAQSFLFSRPGIISDVPRALSLALSLSPLFIFSVLPVIGGRWARMAAGLVAYLVGALLFLMINAGM